MGINGIRVNMKIMVGKMAMKKLKATADARVVMFPLINPFRKKLTT
jgi:hypothetical protein